MHHFAREWQSHWRKNLLPHIRYIATIPCESLRHKSNTFHTNISTLHMFIVPITFTAALLGTRVRSMVTIIGIQFCWICYCGISALFSGITTFFRKMGHQHIVHMTLSPCCRERCQSLCLQRCGHLIRQIWIRWTTASGTYPRCGRPSLEAYFKRGSIARRFMMWRSWKNVCWGSGGCWTTPSLRCSCLNACVRVNGGHFVNLMCYVFESGLEVTRGHWNWCHSKA